jgi:uncharacterized membrane protein HdeD (DUF308 family)
VDAIRRHPGHPVAGLVVMQHPLWGSVLLPATAAIIIGIQAVLSGDISLVIASRGGGWGAGIIGALNAILGLVLLANPLLGGATLVFMAGSFSLLGGIATIAIALRVRKAQAG